MSVPLRLALWWLSAFAALMADVETKMLPHPVIIRHYTHVSALVLVLVGVCLLVVGVRYSPIIAIGAGLMFGGLCGNGGEILMRGYATDWIPVGEWRANVADIMDALGLVCCFVGYAHVLGQRWQRRRAARESA